jgi:protein-L-isoaspartate(D-aspartate) O-methyltransferase
MDPRSQMIEEIKQEYGLNSPKVFSAMLLVSREEFVSPEDITTAYEDKPISLGFGQTISQPYTVAFMTHLLNLKGEESVLEIGTGSGYQVAVLSLLAKSVYSIERIKELAQTAQERLKRLGYKNVSVKYGQGEEGWKEKSPFNAILVTAGMEKVPKILFNQLKEKGVLVAPVGAGEDKIMTKYTKKGGKITKKEYGAFRFVPFIKK